MLRTAKELHDYAMGALDGAIGQVKDLYVDDQAWVVRYLVVETGSWLTGKKVLISPMVIGRPDSAAQRLPVSISKEQVKNSPDFDSEKPVTRQHELAHSSHYGYLPYWGGTGLWGDGMYPNVIPEGYSYSGLETQQAMAPQDRYTLSPAEAARDEHADPHLRSCAEITGYHLDASDGAIGHVSGMVIDDETWAVRYLIVDTSNWWLGHQVLVAPKWIEAVSWVESSISVKLTRQSVKDAPVYEPGQSLTREYEARLHQHHGFSGYWDEGDHHNRKTSHV